MNRRTFITASAMTAFAERAVADPASLPPDLLEALLETYRRHLRGSFQSWCTHALAPIGQEPARHHRLIADALQDVADGRCDRLMLLLPPGSAKSTYASDLYPPWFLSQNPRLNVIAASHTAGLAETFGRRARERVAEHGFMLGIGLAGSGVAAGDWRTDNGGTYYAVGVGGSVTGRRADLALVDDPIASRQDAESERIRNTTWDWFTADLLTRLKPGGRVVLVQTRWHPDDPAGRLLATEGDQWRVLRLPAIAEVADDGVPDPLGREDGEALWPEWENEDALASKRLRVGEREWASLFQQRPRVQGGGLFKVAQIGAIPALPAGGKTVRAWDLAATKATGTRDPDWTVGLLLAEPSLGRYVVADIVRFQGGPDEVEAAIVATAQRDGRAVRIGLPQDPGQAGKAQISYLTGKLAGYIVESSPETGDKATRAAPVAAQGNVGNLSVVTAGWNRVFLSELEDFPAGSKDDQVDALSRAFAMLTAPQPAPSRTVQLPFMSR